MKASQGTAARAEADIALPDPWHQSLFGHLTFREPATQLNKPVRKRRLAMIDVGDD